MTPAAAGTRPTPPRRVLSLCPSATEIVAALGAGSALVGISGECDFPPSVLQLPRVTASALDQKLPSAAIDAEVRRLKDAGQAATTTDLEAIRRLRPDLVVVQDLCDVCAADGAATERLLEGLDPRPAILRLAGTSLRGVEDDIRQVGAALGLEDEADELTAGMRYRLRQVAGRAAPVRRRVVCVEWLDPLYLAGHWVPELVAVAGGEDVGGESGSRSRRRAWAEVAAMRPEVLLVMPCGLGVARARTEWAGFARAHPGVVSLLGSAEVRYLDGTLTSRPGPRLVEAAEAIQEAIRR